MAKSDEDSALIFGAILGGLLTAAVMSGTETKRRNFKKRVAQFLEAHGVGYLSVDFGRGAEGRPTWILTYNDPTAGLGQRRIQLQQGEDPYGEQALKAILSDAASIPSMG